MRTTFPLAAALLLTAPLLAHADVMTGAQIRNAVAGKRIYLATPLGGEFPLYYRRDGKVDGTGEALGLGRWVRPTDTGRWWIAGDSLCQKWSEWYDGKQACFTLEKVGGDAVRWTRDDGYAGTARIAD